MIEIFDENDERVVQDFFCHSLSLRIRVNFKLTFFTEFSYVSRSESLQLQIFHASCYLKNNRGSFKIELSKLCVQPNIRQYFKV